MNNSKKHMIDLLFPVALLFVFACSAVVILLMATGIYKSAATSAAENYSANTCLAYVSEKVHRGNRPGAISLEKIDGINVLSISETHENVSYDNLIYFYDGNLCELFIKSGSPISLSAGKEIMEIPGCTFRLISDSLLEVSCTDENGNSDTQLLHFY